MSSVYRKQVGDVVDARIRSFVREDAWKRCAIVRPSATGLFWIVRLVDGSEHACLDSELRYARRCCECRTVATFTAVPSCKSYCDEHGVKAA